MIAQIPYTLRHMAKAYRKQNPPFETYCLYWDYQMNQLSNLSNIQVIICQTLYGEIVKLIK